MSELFHEIHTSERKAFRGCRERWNWRYREWYQPNTPIKPLEFGIAYHKAMEVLYDPRTWTWDRQVITELAVQTFEETCENQRRTYEELSPSGYLEAEAEKDYEERKVLGRGMIRYYASLMPEMDRGLTPIQVEVPFTVPVTHPITGEQLYCKCKVCKRRVKERDVNMSDLYYETEWKGLPVVYRGRLDCLMMDEHGDYWVYDWKTCTRFMENRDKFLFHDDQISSYCWALMQVLSLNIVGFIYHEQKKAFPQPPKENKVSRKGCKFSVSKQQDTDYETFYKHVATHDANALAAGHYDEYLDWLKTSDEAAKYHERHKIRKTQTELRNVHRNIYLEALDITNPDLRIYPSPGMFNCQWCAYEVPCLGKQRGDDFQYSLETMFTRDAPYYLQPSTDTRGNM